MLPTLGGQVAQHISRIEDPSPGNAAVLSTIYNEGSDRPVIFRNSQETSREGVRRILVAF